VIELDKRINKIEQDWMDEHKRMSILLKRIQSHHDHLKNKDRIITNSNLINYRDFNDKLATLLKEM
jgi:hypothetical protein